MRGRVTLLLLLSLLLSTTAVAQCILRDEYSVPLRTTYFDVVVDGDDLWAATGYGVQLFDRTVDPPRLIAVAALPGTTRTVDVRAGVAYAGSGNAVYVIRRHDQSLEVVRGDDLAATVNDVVATSGALFVATANGLFAFDRRQPLMPAAIVALPTTSANVQSLARRGDLEVLAADGDSSVERFAVSSSNVNAAASLPGLDRSIAVAVAGERIFVSDGQQTKIFAGNGSVIGTAPFGSVTALPIDDDVAFVAGADRRFRVMDVRLPEQPVELFAADIIPTGGTVNRIGALAAAGDRLYVGGGDAGLATWDTSTFKSPYAVRRQSFAAGTSIADGGSSVFIADAGGGLVELTRFSSGILAFADTWAEENTHVIHDFRNDLLLTSNGSTLVFWATKPVPTALRSVTMAGPVRAAVLETNGFAVSLLQDGSVWRSDVQGSSTAIAVPPAAYIARSAGGIALAALNGETGTTDIRFYEGNNFAAPPRTASIAGATTALAAGDMRVAVFTFRGITIVDFTASAASELVLPDSAGAVIRDLHFTGNKLLDVSANGLRVWDVEQRRVVRSFTLAAEPLALSLHPAAAIATVLHADSLTSIHFEAGSGQPAQIAVTGGNRYPKKLVASTWKLFLFDGQSIEVFDTAAGFAPRYSGSIPAAGAIDLAASDSGVFVLSGNGGVTASTHSGTVLNTTTIDEGTDVVPLGIDVVRGTPWISILRGCLTTGCEKKTIVLDPLSLVRTATLEGAINDVAVDGSSAHALVDITSSIELRSYTVADPLHPAVTGSRPTEGGAVAVAARGGFVYALGTRLFTYSQPSLAKIGEQLAASSVSAATDLVVSDSCALVTGRSAFADLYRREGTVWPTPPVHVPLPASPLGIVEQNGRMIVLTDYSIEILWNVLPAPPARRRAAQ